MPCAHLPHHRKPTSFNSTTPTAAPGLSLRKGEVLCALQEVKALKDAALQRGGSFSAVLADYLKSGGALPGPAAQAMAGEAERLLRAADRAAWARPAFRHKALLYVLLAGDRRVAEHLLRVSLLSWQSTCGFFGSYSW